jgi:hypothetical protein
MLNAPYDELQRQLAAFIPAARLVTDPLRLLAWGSDASFYRLVPQAGGGGRDRGRGAPRASAAARR